MSTQVEHEVSMGHPVEDLPSWRRALARGAVIVPMVVATWLILGAPFMAALKSAALFFALVVPILYLREKLRWRQRKRTPGLASRPGIQKPSWRYALARGAVIAPTLTVLLLILGASIVTALGFAVFLSALVALTRYYFEGVRWQHREHIAELDSKARIHKHRSRIQRLVGLIVIVPVLLLATLGSQAWIVKPYEIPSGSMEPTLDVGERIIANRFIYHFEDPSIGDIIVFHPPVGADNGPVCGVAHAPDQACPEPTEAESTQNFVKRIVAGPGDKISVHEGHPVVNGVEKMDEPYTNPCGGGGSCNLPKPITIPPGYYFMMGDNRGASSDSRYWGPIPRDWIVGKAVVAYWPLDHVGAL